MDETRYIIKRSGNQVLFNPEKIRAAIEKANQEEKRLDERLTDEQIEDIVSIIENDVFRSGRALSVEEIQDRVEREIYKRNYNIFVVFHDYRLNRQNIREKSELDKKIEGIINIAVNEDGSVSGQNEEVNQENSNKNPTILSVQRDYIAGEWSKHYMREHVLPPDILKAHDEGLIHFHDLDYSAPPTTNCCLVNLEDMFANGTELSGTMIETPKSFATACTVASQVAAAVASSQHGGQTMTLSHLAPYIDVSRKKIKKRLKEDFETNGIEYTEEKLNNIVENELMKEIEAGCQTIQYQLITLQSTNGQAPFITLFMYINEVPEGQIRDDLVKLIEVVIKQRYKGIKNSKGHYVTVAFPKLIYVLQENNVFPGSKYYWLTELAAKCSAKRLVPDYISEKIMLKLKGDVYPCMGCVGGTETIFYMFNGETKEASFESFWNEMSKYFDIKEQSKGSPHLYMDLKDVKVYDHSKFIPFVDCSRVIRNAGQKLYEYTLSTGETIVATENHLLTEDGLNLNDYTIDELDGTRMVMRDPRHKNRDKPQYPKVVAKKLVDIGYSYDVTTESSYFTLTSTSILSHNCRSFLTPDAFTDTDRGNIERAKNYNPNKHKYYGRANLGVVTINLPDVACSAGGDIDKFWKILDERLELCHRALRLRIDRLKDMPAAVAPILWQYGALARLNPTDKIGKLFVDGYVTISLGYAGIAETIQRLIGESHTTGEGKELTIQILKKLNDSCEKWKKAENIHYSVYGTPQI